jgi:hypothetical protein
MVINSKMGQKALNLLTSHLAGMLSAMMEQTSFDLLDYLSD